jgi:hypothetical protein
MNMRSSHNFLENLTNTVCLLKRRDEIGDKVRTHTPKVNHTPCITDRYLEIVNSYLIQSKFKLI